MGWLHKLRRKPPLRDKIEEIIYRLNTQLEQIKQTFAKIQRRDKEIFEKCIASIIGKDQERASMYANECAEVRKIARILLASELALEQAALRLQTIEELGDIMVQMKPVLGIINGTRKQLAGILPEASHELEDINKTLGNTVLEAGNVPAHLVKIEASDPEAQKVLTEANVVAEQKMKERFPEIPITLPAKEKVAAQPIAITIGKPPASAPPAMSIEQKVYEYIKDHKGVINISQSAADLKVSADSVRRALEKLKEEGKITLE